MSQSGKYNYTRHKLGNKSKKITISQLRQKQLDGEQEYKQLVNTINKYYDSLIDNIQREREQIMMELEKVFSTKAFEIKNRIESSEIAVFSDSQSIPILEYFFKEVHHPIADFNSHAFLLNHIFLAEDNIVQKSILNGFDGNFIRATRYFGQYYYLTSDMDNLLYKNEDLELCNAIPIRVVKSKKPRVSERKWGVVPPQDTSDDWDNPVQLDWDTQEPLKPPDTEWGVVPPQDTSDDWDNPVQSDWDTQEPLEPPDTEWGVSSELDTDWDTPVVESWGEVQNTIDDWADSWIPEAEVPLPEHDTPFDFVIIKHHVFVTFQISKIICSYLLTDRLTNLNNISNKFLSQPRGMCVIEYNINLLYIADINNKKISAFDVDDFIKSTVQNVSDLECKFTVQFGESEYPLLLRKNYNKREILILTLSNNIYLVSATGHVLHKLAYSGLISPFDMKVVEGGKMFVVDLESLVVLDLNGGCMSKYFCDKFSFRGCINCTEDSVEVITHCKDMEYAGVENIEICLL